MCFERDCVKERARERVKFSKTFALLLNHSPLTASQWLSQCKLAPLDGVDSLIELYGQQITQAIVYDVNVRER